MVTEALNILLADDNSDDVFLLHEAFKKAGTVSRLNAVPDGMAAMAYLHGQGAYSDRNAYPFPDVLLLDLNMPRMNGFEVLRSVRQEMNCTELIVHVLSASSRQDDVQRAYSLGANSYVVKPNRLDELVRFVVTLHQWHHFTTFPRQA